MAFGYLVMVVQGSLAALPVQNWADQGLPSAARFREATKRKENISSPADPSLIRKIFCWLKSCGLACVLSRQVGGFVDEGCFDGDLAQLLITSAHPFLLSKRARPRRNKTR